MSGPLPNILAPLTIPLSWIYSSAIAARNKKFDRGNGIQSIDRPVISVGNINTGGTGKSPMVAWIIDQLRDAGHCPVIAMRGYGAAVDDVSDEEAEYERRLPGVPVLAFPDRAAALRAFLPEHPEVDCIVLDDGFQHRQLKRDLDLVLIDATSNCLNDRMLPAGHLREPPDSLRRADVTVITHADAHDERLTQQIERHHGCPPLAWSKHIWTHLDVFDRSIEPLHGDLNWLKGKRVLTMLGVGKPQAILQQLQSLGADVAVNVPARDHERYDRPKLTMARGLAENCDAMVVTGKDWVKVRSLIDSSSWPVPIVVPQLAIEVFEGADDLRYRLLSLIVAPTAGPRKPAR